jgi:hypothetical protein
MSDVEDLGVGHDDAALVMVAIETLRSLPGPFSSSTPASRSARARPSSIGRPKPESQPNSLDSAAAASLSLAPFVSPRETSRMRRCHLPPAPNPPVPPPPPPPPSFVF